MTTRIIAFAATLIIGSASTAEAAIIVSEWGLLLKATESGTDSVTLEDNTVALPFSTTLTASTIGGTESTALYDFAVNGDTGSFHFEIDHHRSGAVGPTESQNLAFAEIFFQVTTDSSFDFDGSFSLDGGGRFRVVADLRDLTISGGIQGVMYRSLQQSLNTQNEEFQIGGLDGDHTNSLIGSLPGVLVPGHEYHMVFTFDIATPLPNGDSGADANGYLDFTINPGAPPDPPAGEIPEPTTLAIWSILAGVGLVAVKRRRQKAAR